jgi:hypothetical protein
MSLYKALGCAIVLAFFCGLGQAQTDNVSGEITFANGKTQNFTRFSTGYSQDVLFYADNLEDLRAVFKHGSYQFSEMRSAKYSGLSEIDFVEMSKEETSVVEKGAGPGDDVRKVNLLLRDGRKLEGVFITFAFSGWWGDGTLSGKLVGPKVAKVTLR